MFSALKRLTGGGGAGSSLGSGAAGSSNTSQQPASHLAMSQNLQRKFAKGIQYNMKIIIKGDRNTGKTCLFHRLQGNKFIQEYTPTEEIQVACINWSYKTADDVVKVEVWDVVDKGKKRPQLEGLKLSDECPPALDAEFLDVYKGTNGIILIFDITKNWTFEYIEKELDKVPKNIPVLIIGNHCDMAHHRTITSETVHFFIESCQRENEWAQLRYTEASMSNGFGLKYLHKFFCLPFLQLQRNSLLSQLERNSHETNITLQELDLYQQSPDSDYNLFLENLSKKRRQKADSSGVNNGVQGLSSYPTASIVMGEGKRIEGVRSGSDQRSSSGSSGSNNGGSGSSSGRSPVAALQSSSVEVAQVVTSVEEFVPDGGFLDKSFLEEAYSFPSSSQPLSDPPSDSEGEVGDNPLVAGYEDDVELEDEPPPPRIPTPPRISTPPVNVDDDSTQQLENWIGNFSIIDRGSPEGGEDSVRTDSPTLAKSSKKKHSKRQSVKKKDEAKSEKKKKKKVKVTSGVDEIGAETVHDPAYEEI